MQTVQVQIAYPARLSRGILLLKTFFGWLILIPHFICLFVLGILSSIVAFLSWFAVLFTGKYPKSFFNLMVGVNSWGLRIGAYMGLLCDQYPKFGLEADYPTQFNVTYPEKLSRGVLILRTLFGFIYVLIPHGFCLFFRSIAHGVLLFIGWWAILFTGKLPAGMFNFMAGTYRWQMNLYAYFMFLTDEYPPFSGKDDGKAAVETGVPA